jgi:predicted protein tyrosine phosphatase
VVWVTGCRCRRRAGRLGLARELAPAGDPAKLAQALLTITAEQRPPRRFIAGADAIETAEQRVAGLQQQIGAYRELSSALAYDPAQTAA